MLIVWEILSSISPCQCMNLSSDYLSAKYGVLTSSISFYLGCVRNLIIKAHPTSTKPHTLGVGSSTLGFNYRPPTTTLGDADAQSWRATDLEWACDWRCLCRVASVLDVLFPCCVSWMWFLIWKSSLYVPGNMVCYTQANYFESCLNKVKTMLNFG